MPGLQEIQAKLAKTGLPGIVAVVKQMGEAVDEAWGKRDGEVETTVKQLEVQLVERFKTLSADIPEAGDKILEDKKEIEEMADTIFNV